MSTSQTSSGARRNEAAWKMQQQGESKMNEKEIREHAKSKGIKPGSNEEFYYFNRILEKKSLIGEQTKKTIFKLVGDRYLELEDWKQSNRYYLMAGRKDLHKTIILAREKAEERHNLAESLACDFNHYKNN